MTRRSVLGVGALLLLVLATAALAASGGDAGPEGTLALRRFLAAMDLDVRDAEDPPQPPGTFVLLVDLRDESATAELLDWVAGGGSLVVADPTSLAAERVGVESGPVPGPFGLRRLEPGCDAPPAAGVGTIVVSPFEPLLSAGGPSVTCYHEGPAAYVVQVPHGRGTVTVVGGTSSLTNELLREADNAVFAFSLVTSPVVFGPPSSGGRSRATGLWGTLPPAARAVLIQLAIAAFLFALARARRLGRPVPEMLPSPIPASELVRATGTLYRSARAAGFVGEMMRGATIERLAHRFGRPLGDDIDALSAAVAHQTGLHAGRVKEVLAGREPDADGALISLARELDHIRRASEGGDR